MTVADIGHMRHGIVVSSVDIVIDHRRGGFIFRLDERARTPRNVDRLEHAPWASAHPHGRRRGVAGGGGHRAARRRRIPSHQAGSPTRDERAIADSVQPRESVQHGIAHALAHL